MREGFCVSAKTLFLFCKHEFFELKNLCVFKYIAANLTIVPLFGTILSEDRLNLNNKQKATLREVFEDPVKSSIRWTDIEILFTALGGVVSEGNGSRVRVKLNGVFAVFHRPHPQKETDKGAVKSVRRFLTNAGVKL